MLGKNNKIVVVDDSKVICHQLEFILSTVGAELVFFSSSKEALAYLTEHDDISMLITDWIMPELEGPELIKAVKELEHHKLTYIMMMTGLNESSFLVKGLDLGADDFIGKPVVPEELVAKVKSGNRIQALKNELLEKNMALNNAIEHMKADLQAGAQMSMKLLPSEDLSVEGIEMGSFFKPCEYVGGDLFGYQKVTREALVFYQIDVAGHGIPAALMSFSLGHEMSKNNLFSNTIIQYERADARPEINGVEQAVAAINQSSLSHINMDTYFTMTYGSIDISTGLVKYCQAGHPPMILLSTTDQKATQHGAGGFPVGIMIDAAYEQQQLQMEQDDILFIFSDGILEAENEAGEIFGAERLCELIVDGSQQDYSIKQLLEFLYQHVVDWSKADKLDDDVTMIAFQWNG